MTTTYVEAVDQMFALFKVAVDSNSTAVVGYVPEIRWQGVKENSNPDPSKYWFRASQQTVDEDQSTIANENGVKRYTAIGFVTVQLFCPKSDVASQEKGRKLSVVARNAFRGKKTAGQVWFRNVRIVELPNEENFRRFNIQADYEYDEIN